MKKFSCLFLPALLLCSNLLCGQEICVSPPLRSLQLNQGFGWRIHPVTGRPDFHNGIDLHARNEPVLVIISGRVMRTGEDIISGKYIQICHNNGMRSIYAHLSRILIAEKDSVTAGEIIAFTGNTGRVTGEHLHFALRYKGIWINPIKFFLALSRLP